ncbi:MAG: ATP-binding protein [Desulfosarcinaceae bacterium]
MHDYIVARGIDAKLVLTDTHVNALRKLSSGKSDYALVANLPALYTGRELKLTNVIQVSKPIARMPYCYAARKGNDNLLTVFSEGLAILKNTGRHQQIYDKWLGVYASRGIPWANVVKLSLVVGVPLLFFMSFIMMWNRSLKRQVARRTEEIRAQQEQLLQADKLASLGILVSGVAHEINNPNSSVLMNLSLIEDTLKDSSDILEAHYQENGDFKIGGLNYSRMRAEIPLIVKDTRTAARKIRRIVEDLKDFARQGDSNFTEEIDLNDVINTTVRLMENTIQKATNHFQMQLSDYLPKVKANIQRIEQVVVNLILNACQALTHMDQGITIKSEYSLHRNQITITVEDEGDGIAEEHLAHVFDPFFTTKRESGGTGLGLAVSATIVKEHGGRLFFRSNRGQGTAAIMQLPVETKETK